MGVLVVSAGVALAGKAPSTADTLQVGVPFSASVFDYYERQVEWLRLPGPLLPADRIQFTLVSDNGMRTCVAPATDDFGRLDREDECGVKNYPGTLTHVDTEAGMFRRSLTYSGQPTAGFVLVSTDTRPDTRVDANFTITLEKLVHRVRLGTLNVTVKGRKVTARTVARLTNNAAAPEGHPGELRVKYGNEGWRRVASGSISGGALRFGFTARKSARDLQLRLCTTAVGDATSVCTPRKRVRLAPRR